MSSPTELYRFAQAGKAWTYTSADTPVDYNGETYATAPIARDKIEQSGEINKSNLPVTLPRTNEVAALFLADTPDLIVTLTLYRQQDGNTVVLWKGRAAGHEVSVSEVTIEFEPVYTSLRRPGLRGRFQRNCRHTHYRKGCNLNKAVFAVAGFVDAVADEVITVPEAAAFSDGYFTAGMLETDHGIARWIVAHSGSAITLSRPITGYADRLASAGWGLSWGLFWGGKMAVTLYPGCDRTRQTCQDRFDNLENHGGFPWVPRRNPFDGNSIV